MKVQEREYWIDLKIHILVEHQEKRGSLEWNKVVD